MKSYLVLALALALAGCAGLGDKLTATTSEAQCSGWAPIRYNSHKPKSEFYAGPKLSPQIAEHNLTGENLKCPKFQ